MRVTLSRLLAAGLALLACSAHPQATERSLDFATGHAWAGLGTQVWLQQTQPEAVQMLRDMNARYARIALLPNRLPVDRLQPGMTVAQIAPVLAAAIEPKHAQQVDAYRDLAARLSLRTHLVFWHMPEEWEDTRQQKAGSHPSAHFARDDRIGDWANLAVACMAWLRGRGIVLDAVELTNEPHGAWDTKFTPAQYADLVLKARVAMDAAGLEGVKIDGPGTGVRNFDEFREALEARHAMPALGYITAHAYQSAEQMADGSATGYAGFLGQGRFGPIVITEFGVKKHNADEAGAEGDLDLASPRYAVNAAAEALLLIGRGATSAFYWQLQDRESSKKEHGLLDPAGRRRPVAAAVAALFGHLPPGGTAAAAVGGPARVPVEGVLVDGQVHLLMANLTDVAQPIVVRLAGAGAPRQAVGGQAGYAAAGPPAAALTGAAMQGGVFRGTLAPRSVASVVLP
jgi:hypothetical protein